MSSEGRLGAQPEDKEQTVEGTVPDENPKPKQIQNISVQEILNNYPIDREKCRDVIRMEMSQSLVRIANSLEGISQGLIVANTHLSAMNTLKKQGQ